MKKFLSLMMLAMMSVGTAWADTEVSPEGGSSNAAVNGKSFSINGTTNAGSGTQINPMSGKGIKVRKSTPLVMTVNEGYRINSVTVYAASNDNSKTFQISKIEVDGTEYVPTGKAMPITCAQKNATEATTIEITGIAAKKNITFTFDGESTQGIMEFHVDYTQEEVIVQEITAVTFNGTPISETDLATLKSTKALTIDGSALNGVGMVDVTLSSGGTTVTKVIDGTTATYSFTINGTDAYTVTVNNLAGTYTEQGAVVYYKKNDTEADGTNSKTVTANGITFTMDADKTFQYGVGSVTMGDNKYVPLKLSTGCGVNVTFPEGKVATKAIVYGWSASGNGKLTAFKETADAEEKVVDVSGDVFYATNQASDTYPSVYEYDLDNWESLYFNAGGSASQPFVVIDFVLADKPAAPATETVNVTVTSVGYATFSSDKNLDFTNAKKIKAYTATISGNQVTFTRIYKVPAGTGVLLWAAGGATEDIPVIAEAPGVSSAFKVAQTEMNRGQLTEGGKAYVLGNHSDYGIGFYQPAEGFTLPEGKCYLQIPEGEARIFLPGMEATGIGTTLVKNEGVKNEIFNLNGQRINKLQKGLNIVNGKKVIVK